VSVEPNGPQGVSMPPAVDGGLQDGTAENPIMYFEADGSGPHWHVCGEERSPRARIRQWIDRQTKLHGASGDGPAMVERLLEDLF